MSIYEHLDTFAGRPVEDWGPGGRLPDLGTTAVRLRVDEFWEAEGGAQLHLVPMLDALVAAAGPQVEALVIGVWGQSYGNDSGPIVRSLAGHAAGLPALRAVFLGDVTQEEAEISWIEQSDVTPLLGAFPALEQLWVRGGTGLRLEPVAHHALHTLVVESGGLPAAVARAIGASTLPSLRHLELWLGDAEYGGDVDPAADLAPILAGRLPVTRLGLRNADRQDDVAAAVADAPVVDGLATLDLSLGNLTDTGAEHLLASSRIRTLRRLDVHHHYLTDAMVQRLLALPIEVDASDGEEAEDDGDGEVYLPIFVAE